MSKKVPTPKPVVIEQECSICELDWDLHPDDPTVLDCIELLKTEATRKRSVQPITWPYITVTGCCTHGPYTYCSCSCHVNWSWTNNSTPHISYTNTAQLEN